jgi:hypothetical protein
MAVINTDSLLEANKDLKQNDTTQHETIQTGCSFDNPDTSLSGIKLRDPKSSISVLGMTKLEGDTTYNFSSSDKKQVLSVTVHPGDLYSAISIFKVRYTDNSIESLTLPTIDNFKTEKDIQLGLTKKELLKKLGECFTVSDSTNNSVTINYRLEAPKDSKTKLLERQNMPIYYATYKFKSDKLVEFEFGFEYP